MIARIWHGYTTPANAEIYEKLLKQEIFIGIENKNVKGYRGIQLLRRELVNEVEFTTIMWFDKIESVRKFAGENYETAYVPEKAREVLSRFDDKSIHCELRHELQYDL
jgi:antibiotic biosynthesis monooxygenase (ABM) superfamily enzyme